MGGLRPRWPLVLRSHQLPHAYYTSMYLEVIAVLRPHFLSCTCVFSFLFAAKHVKSLAFCVWEWRLNTIQYKNVSLWTVAQCEKRDLNNPWMRVPGKWKKACSDCTFQAISATLHKQSVICTIYSTYNGSKLLHSETYYLKHITAKP